MTDGDDIDMLAAEFVLGSLSASERAAVAARRQREPVLDDAIAQWERRLGPLADHVPPVAPPAALFAKVEERIDRTEAGADRRRMAGETGAAVSTIVLDLQRGLRRWRMVALAASAVAAGLALVVGLEQMNPRPLPNYVGVFQKDDESPAFLLTVDVEARLLTIRPVAAPAAVGKTYQLWIAAEPLGSQPRSLGLIQTAEFTTHRVTVPLDTAALRQATFGVSLEPAGGSPTGVPTGPALHAKLIRATP